MAAYRRRDVKGRMEFVDIAGAGFDAGKYGLELEEMNQAMHVTMADGRVFTAVRAFVKIWEAVPSFWTGVLRVLLKVPGVMFLAGVFYRWFARNRYRLTGRCTAESCELKS
jgi:predicted DCC family thiol-disulfide oxidoreductase YuxK